MIAMAATVIVITVIAIDFNLQISHFPLIYNYFIDFVYIGYCNFYFAICHAGSYSFPSLTSLTSFRG